MSLYMTLTAITAALALVSQGGALYEYWVLDPVWPRRPDLIQPQRGGASRRRFWIPTYVALEEVLIAALVATWSQDSIRFWLLLGLTSHAVMRVWSAFDFIPKALAFERTDAGEISETVQPAAGHGEAS